jgi:putative tryptophan/tyrosine transport system substrate-binding protein
LSIEVAPKRLQLLHPTARVVALLVNPANSTVAETQLREARSAANALGLELHILNASDEHDFDTVFANLIQLRADGLVIAADDKSALTTGFWIASNAVLSALRIEPVERCSKLIRA